MMQAAMDALPVVAILRGIKPDEVKPIAEVLYAGGVRCVEVPLNSPSPFDSVEILAKSLPKECVVGAGTVMRPEDVRKVHDVGGQLIVTPNTEPAVIKSAVELEMIVTPGIATATEAFSAVAAGASWLKVFPASTYGPGHVRALRAVLPDHIRFLAVGGVGVHDLADWTAAGVAGLGIGSELYRSGDTPANVSEKLASIHSALQAD